jgi:large subunit ribosomal protein L32
MRMASSISFVPRLLSPTVFSTTRIQLYVRQFSLPLFPSLSLAVPVGIQLGLPSLPSILEGIWESILKAVPKKKTSHMKKRHRQMAGKALKDVNSLCKCPACGEIKRMHYLCPHCASSMETESMGGVLHADNGNRTQGDDEQGGEGEERMKQFWGGARIELGAEGIGACAGGVHVIRIVSESGMEV